MTHITVTRDARRIIHADLLDWYDCMARDLPWRTSRKPYEVWLSEIILQQTRVDQGLPYYRRFLAAFPTVERLAAASTEEVLKLWEGLGYYSRARNLHHAARIIVDERGGRFPASAIQWRELPGIGRYTAGAIASIAFGEQTAVLDGNVKRVLARLYRIEESIDEKSTTEAMWTLCEQLVPEDRPGDFNQAMMDLGATVCKPRVPSCETCPLQRLCVACLEGRQHELPRRSPKRESPSRHMLALAVRKRGRILIVRRPETGFLGGLWELPAIEMRAGDEPTATAARLLAQCGLAGHPGGQLASVRHTYSHLKLTMDVYACQWERGEACSPMHIDHKWVYPPHFKRYAFHRAVHKVLPLLANS